MTSNEVKIEVPKDILENWQEIVNILAGTIRISGRVDYAI